MTPPTTPPLVLAVEDNPTLRNMYRFVLNGAGFDCRTCETVADARAALAELTAAPDLLVIDAQLPDGDGADLLDEARKAFPDIGPHTLLVTGMDPGAALRELRDRVAVEVLSKPFRVEPFLEICLRLSRRAPGG